MSSKKKFSELRTGVIGVGSMGQNHARIYNKISNLVAVSDKNKGQAKLVAERLGVTYYENFEEMLENVDAVSIAVPTALHLPVVKKVASYGKHMLVEKPLASNSKDAKKIVDIANECNIKLAVGHIERHNPVVKIAKKAIDKKNWGDLITLSSRRVSNFPSRIHDVGVLFDLLIHDLDIATYLVNDNISKVYTAGGQMKAEHEDYSNVILTFEKGIVSVCEANWLTPMKIRSLGITTSSHYVKLDYQAQSIEMYNSSYSNVDKSNLYEPNLNFESEFLEVVKKEPLLLEISDFLNSIISDSKPLVTGEDGLNVVRVSEAALKSLNKKEAISVNIGD